MGWRGSSRQGGATICTDPLVFQKRPLGAERRDRLALIRKHFLHFDAHKTWLPCRLKSTNTRYT